MLKLTAPKRITMTGFVPNLTVPQHLRPHPISSSSTLSLSPNPASTPLICYPRPYAYPMTTSLTSDLQRSYARTLLPYPRPMASCAPSLASDLQPSYAPNLLPYPGPTTSAAPTLASALHPTSYAPNLSLLISSNKLFYHYYYDCLIYNDDVNIQNQILPLAMPPDKANIYLILGK